LIIASMLKEY